jgi:hypothetical protein
VFVCFIVAIIISAATRFNDPNKLDPRLFYDIRKIFCRAKVAAEYDLQKAESIEVL